MTDRALTGLSVVDAAIDRAGSIAGMLLADLGADVVRVQTASGEHRRPDPGELPDAVCWDRGKRSVTVGALDPSDRELGELLDGADVLLVDHTPAEFATSPLNPDRRTGADPRLVTVWTPPYGALGDAHRDLRADPLLQSAVTAFAMHQPAFDPDVPIAPVIDVVGAIQGSLGASAALAGALDAMRSGSGQLATVSAVDAVGALVATLVNAALDVDEQIRSGRNPRIGPSFRPYRCADGEMLFLATLVAPLFFKALEVLDAFEVLTMEGVEGEFFNLFRPDVGPRAAALLEDVFASKPRDHWLDRFTEAGVPAEPVLTRDEWLASDKFATAAGRHRFEHPVVGQVSTPDHPATIDPADATIDPATVWPHNGATSARPGPLSGLRVLDVATFLAGPYSPSLMAYWGADVVKFEPADGDPYRAYSVSYLAVNQAKRSVQLDFDDGEGRSVFERLVAGADVMIDNFRPSTRDKLGLDLHELRRLNPGLVHGNVTSFGPGEFAERPGFDPCIQALSGMMSAIGAPDEPLNTTTPVHDVAAGASTALGVLAVLWQRATTGRAGNVTTSLASAASLLQCAELTGFDGRPPRAQGGIDFVGASAEHRFHRAADGWIGVAARSPGELYRALTGADPGDGADLDTSIADAVAHRSVADALATLAAADIPAVAPVGRADWGTDPYLDVNHFTHVVVDPTFGRCRVMRGAGSWSRSGVHVPEAMAAPGADTAAVTDSAWHHP